MKTIKSYQKKCFLAISFLLLFPSPVFASKVGGSAGPLQVVLSKLTPLLGNLSFTILELIKYSSIPVFLLCILIYGATDEMPKRNLARSWGIIALISGILAWSGALTALIEALFV